VESNFHDKLPIGLDANRMDNRIIGVALGLQEKAEIGRKIVMISKDINLRVKCDALGVMSEDYNADSVAENASLIYSGNSELIIDDALVDRFHKDEFIELIGLGDFCPNQYVHIKSVSNPKKSGLARVDKDRLVKIKTHSVWGITSRNKEQAFALDALFNPDIKLVTMVGTAGTGKTLLAAAAGISQLFDSHIYKKLIMTRPVQPMGKDIGFLPGDIDEKMKPWMAPLQDNLELLFSDKGANFLDMQREAGLIEVEALTYIRGRSIPKSFIIIDESQNLTLHEIKTIITRVGEDSKIVLTGDIMQIDNPYIDSVDNGLSCVIEKFKNHSIAAHVTLTRGERSQLATLASEIL
jgi:PhoH-like ATPase